MPTCLFVFQNKSKCRNLSGYIVFAAEYRKEIANDNPDFTFGEISRVVGAKVGTAYSVHYVYKAAHSLEESFAIEVLFHTCRFCPSCSI